MTPSDHPERLAFYAAIEANPDDFLTYGVFADWLDDHGEGELAEGMRAMMRLRVTLDPDVDVRQQGGLNSFGRSCPEYEAATRCERAEGNRWFVTEGWRDATFELWGGADGYSARVGEKIVSHGQELREKVALAYSRLTPEQKAEAERLLAPAEGQ
jgi:uncharacterized protein (TIGR02996 family)